jgi:hypothetical protein
MATSTTQLRYFVEGMRYPVKCFLLGTLRTACHSAAARISVSATKHIRKGHCYVARNGKCSTGHFAFARQLAHSILDSTSPAALVSIRRAARALEATGLIVSVPDISTSKFWRLASVDKRHQTKKKAKERKRAKERQQEEEAARRWAMAREYEPSRPPNPNLAKLAKILGMLGSAADGEALAAARRAEKLRRQMDVTWEKLLFVDLDVVASD